MTTVPVAHNWSADNWDWPLQHNDGVVKVHNTSDAWEVGLDAVYFTPKEIDVKVINDQLVIHCLHEERQDNHGSIKREINRTYHMPADVDTATIKSHLTNRGLLRITASKKK